MQKAKKYDWKDSNMALFGSDIEKNVKRTAAENEAAWSGCGQAPGLKIWRIVNFKVTDWPEDEYGQFFSGDSYIILNTYKPDPNAEGLAWDVHFWIGKYSSQDEYGTAAYKTVELDTYLNDGPVQHREVMGYESTLFKTYFPNGISLLEGGAESGFKKVKPEEYRPRLLQYTRDATKKVTVKEVPRKATSLFSGDVFILDKGLTIYQWNGTECQKEEKFKAMQFVQQLVSERNGRPKHEALEEADTAKSHDFYESLNDDEAAEPDDGDAIENYSKRPKKMFRLSDASGKMEFQLVKEGKISRDDLDSKDAFIIDAGTEVIVWVGSQASKNEKLRGLEYAHNYIKESDANFLPVTVVKENQVSKALDDAFHKPRKGQKCTLL